MTSVKPWPLRSVRDARYALCAYTVALLVLTSLEHIVSLGCAVAMPGVLWTDESTTQVVMVLGKSLVLGGIAYVAWILPSQQLAKWFVPAMVANAAMVTASVAVLGRNSSVEHLSFIGLCLLGAFSLRTTPAYVVTGVSMALFILAQVLGGVTVPDLSDLVASVTFAVGFVYSLSWAASRQQASVEKLRDRLTTDALTGLSNRRVAEPYLSTTSSGSQVCAGLVLVDLDGFKSINDEHGHLVGDAVLRLVASVLVAVADQYKDLVEVCRLGGDEFALVVRTASSSVVEEVAASVSKSFDGLNIEAPTGESLKVQASVGCAHWPVDSSVAASLYSAADERLYKAKEDRKATACGEQSEGCGAPSLP